MITFNKKEGANTLKNARLYNPHNSDLCKLEEGLMLIFGDGNCGQNYTFGIYFEGTKEVFIEDNGNTIKIFNKKKKVLLEIDLGNREEAGSGMSFIKDIAYALRLTQQVQNRYVYDYKKDQLYFKLSFGDFYNYENPAKIPTLEPLPDLVKNAIIKRF